jgi:hypothetical protein
VGRHLLRPVTWRCSATSANKSHSLGNVVSSPFSILVKVVDGQVTYLQFLEDTYATAASCNRFPVAPCRPLMAPRLAPLIVTRSRPREIRLAVGGQ